MDENRIAKLMKNLDVTRDEALEILEVDKAIDKGAKLFELTDEQKKAAKKACRADSKPHSKPRAKKADPEREFVMEFLWNAVQENCGNAETAANGREIFFIYKERKYRITVACPHT